jgi:hypothetical membrane protein
MKGSTLIGLLGAVAAYPFMLASIAMSPWFNVYNNALSDLGNVANNGPVAYVYNIGLVLAGLLVAIFAVYITSSRRSGATSAWSIPLAIGSADLALIGVFSEDAGRIHGIVSLIFFLIMAITLLIYSYASWPLGSPRVGAISLFFGIASALIWFIPWPWRGVAIQEATTSGMTAVWLILVALKNT